MEINFFLIVCEESKEVEFLFHSADKWLISIMTIFFFIDVPGLVSSPGKDICLPIQPMQIAMATWAEEPTSEARHPSHYKPVSFICDPLLL